MSLTFNKNASCLTLFLNGVLHTIPSDSPNFKNVWNAVKSNDEDAVEASLNVVEAIEKGFETVVGKGVKVTEDGVYFNGKRMHNCLSDKIMEFMAEGIPFTPIVLLLENFTNNQLIKLASNPEVLVMMNKRPDQADEVIDELTDDFFSFLNHRNMPITEDGCFLAYKTLDGNYWSKHGNKKTILTKGKTNDQGQIYNAPGEEIECERGQVDPSRVHECSYGLHVGCLEYSGPNGWYHSSSDKIVVVKVNPKDVIAVPPDHNRTKMRVCSYTVIQDYVSALNRPAYKNDSDLYSQEAEYIDEDDVTRELDSVNEIYDGDEIRFTYFKEDGEKTRYLDVTEVKYDSDDNVIRIGGILMSPEKNSGQYRSFRPERISDIKLLS